MKRISTFKIVIVALFAALICVATMLVQIPIPATGGYANLGDGIILVCAFLMGPVPATVAAGIGSMLADILAGYASYAPATLVIKALLALIAALIYGKLKHKPLLSMLVAAITAEVWMVAGYFFYEAVILGMGMAAAAGIIGNVGQGVVSVAVACVLAPALLKSSEIREMLNRNQSQK